MVEDPQGTQAKVRFGLAEEVPVLSYYKAGRDGFWLHRYLDASCVRNPVMDSTIIKASQR